MSAGLRHTQVTGKAKGLGRIKVKKQERSLVGSQSLGRLMAKGTTIKFKAILYYRVSSRPDPVFQYEKRAGVGAAEMARLLEQAQQHLQLQLQGDQTRLASMGTCSHVHIPTEYM